MKVGDNVLIGWCGFKNRYLVKVDSITEEGFQGSYMAYDSENKKVSGYVSGPYMFVWGNVNNIEEAPEGVALLTDLRVVLNKEYTAIIAQDKQSVTVGCQTFPRAIVLALADKLR